MLKEKISKDLKDALKSGDSIKTGTLRMILASFNNKEIEKRGKGPYKAEPSGFRQESVLSEEEEIDVLSKEAKKRKESLEAYQKGGREDLAQKEKQELEIIKKYLPEQLSQEEIEKLIDSAIQKTGASSIKDLGKIMAEVSKEAKGKADMKAISEIIKKKLGI